MASDQQVQLHVQLSRYLTLYSTHVAEQINAKASATMQRIVDTTRATAPRRASSHGKPHFYRSITSKELATPSNESAFLWYVRKPNFRLTHLLESDHKSRSGRTVSGYHFVQRALDEELPAFEADVKEVLRNAD